MNPWKKMIITAFAITIVIIAGTVIYFQLLAKRRLIISTTTSLYDTGLLDTIEKVFETKHSVDLNFIPVGTGIAMQHAMKGDVDVTLVHSPSLERVFLEEGYGVCRKIIAYNFFTIVGPETDPAGAKGLNTTEALKRIAAYGNQTTKILWVSRGDNSGTHQKEKSLWKTAGFDWTGLSTESWYASVGSGMGATQLKAEEFSAYTLSDIGTYLKYSKEGLISLKAFVTEEQELLNVYSVAAVNQTLHHHINLEDAITFIKFLISEECQQLIEHYGKDEYEQILFHDAVQLLKQNSSSQIVQWIKDYAFFSGSECPPEYRDDHPELYG